MSIERYRIRIEKSAICLIEKIDAMQNSQLDDNFHARDQILAAGDKAWKMLAEHRLAASPQAYEVLFNHCAGTHADISIQINAFLKHNALLSLSLIESLYRKCVSGDDNEAEAYALSQGADALAEAANSIVAKVASNHGNLLTYGETLAHWTKHLGNSHTVESLMQTMSALAAETDRASERNRSLERELATSAHQISKLRHDLVAVRHEAAKDPLTGIANRRAFDTRLRRAVKQRRTEPSNAFCLLLMDIDHFKRFNDIHGHQTGDQVLRLVGHILSDNVKGRDTAARYGGEEFAILLDGADVTAGHAVAKQLCENIAQRRLVKRSTGESIGQLTCSIGVAQYQANEIELTLIERADQALYEAKRTGRNRVCLAK